MDAVSTTVAETEGSNQILANTPTSSCIGCQNIRNCIGWFHTVADPAAAHVFRQAHPSDLITEDEASSDEDETEEISESGEEADEVTPKRTETSKWTRWF